jgi:hypothetical protein
MAELMQYDTEEYCQNKEYAVQYPGWALALSPMNDGNPKDNEHKGGMHVYANARKLAYLPTPTHGLFLNIDLSKAES